MNKIELKSKDPNQVSTGANTELYINGKKATGVKSFKYEVDAAGVGTATVEYYANVEIESNVPGLILTEEFTADLTKGCHEISNFEKIQGEDDVSK